MEFLIGFMLLIMSVATALLIAFNTNLFVVIMLAGIFSLLSAAVFVIMNAPDVAFAEAAVGAGAATMLFLATTAATGQTHSYRKKRHFRGLFLAAAVTVMLMYSVHDMPGFADPNAPGHRHVASYYLTHTASEIGVPNVVTAVLASYRGFDTLGELVVIFTAGVGVLGVLAGRHRRKV